jgi:hypothetical protein
MVYHRFKDFATNEAIEARIVTFVQKNREERCPMNPPFDTIPIRQIDMGVALLETPSAFFLATTFPATIFAI